MNKSSSKVQLTTDNGQRTASAIRESTLLSLLPALCILLSAFCLLCFGCSRRKGPGPLSPQESLKTFRLSDPNLRVEVFAAEPDVVDPVEIVFDEDGRVFAAEMRDYPEDPLPGQPPKSRIRLLEDADGDGKVDRSVIFADNLLQVTSMLPWKGGLIVTAAPEILYLKDTDGDGKADVRKVLFSGFALANPESRITNLRFGVDNWIYAANNGQRGNITFPGRDLFLKSEYPHRERESGGAGERESLYRQKGGFRNAEDAQSRKSVSVLGADFRFRLDRGLFETESGPTQFGLALDDWGHRFITENTTHVRHVVMARRYLLRNPLLPAGAPAEDISDHGRPTARMFQLTPPQYWRQVRTTMRQQRYRENNLNRNEIVAGFFTAAAGGTIYLGDRLPEEYYGNLFTGDVSGNLVHRDTLIPSGASFTASRAPGELDKEFLASTDPWFRPCSFATGPDGNFYVVDMYREFIETPESIPEELKKDMDFYSGTTMGRIYRIVPKNTAARGWPAEPRPLGSGQPEGRRQLAEGSGKLTVGPRLSESGQTPAEHGMKKLHLSTTPTADLVPLLAHRNGWWRLTAQRLILERQDKSVVPALRKMVVESDFPQARLHALYALEGLSALDEDLVERALSDSNPGVREHALQLAEIFSDAGLGAGFASGKKPAARTSKLASKLISMVDDPSPRVRFQLALSLGAFPGDATWKALATLACREARDPWFRTAILSSVGQPPSLPAAAQAAQLTRLTAFLAERNYFEKFDEGRGKFLEQLAAGVGVRNDGENTARFLSLMSNIKGLQGRRAGASSAVSMNSDLWRIAALSGLARGLALAQAQRLRLPATEAQLSRLLASPSERVEAAARAVAGHFEMRSLISASVKQALDASLTEAKRKVAIQSLSSGDFREVRPVFEKLLSSQPAPGLLQAALSSLNSIDDPGVADLLISRWKLFSPAARGQALDVLLNHRQRIPALLQAIERGEIERSALDLTRRQKLLQNPDPAVVSRASRLFKDEHTDRAKVLVEYRSVLALPGDTTRGRAVFDKNCAQCHMPQKGRRIGPDLSGVSSQTKEQLLQNILDPSREIQARFTNYIVTTKGGRIVDGLIVSETPGTITLRSGDADDEAVLRRNIAEIRASSISLMPEDLEKNMSKQELADVIAFLQGAGLHHHHER